MEGIGEKFARLPPHLQREVEDYIDFLLERRVTVDDAAAPPVPAEIPREEPPLGPSPIIAAEEIPFRPAGDDLFPPPDPPARATTPATPARIIEITRRARRDSEERGREILEWID
ncbi:MAG: hypothetical protein QXL43_03400 [Methanolinea sp.]|nr:hypothetical protein [Methanolinea sp.]